MCFGAVRAQCGAQTIVRGACAAVARTGRHGVVPLSSPGSPPSSELEMRPMCRRNPTEKGKPGASRGRKARGLTPCEIARLPVHTRKVRTSHEVPFQPYSPRHSGAWPPRVADKGTDGDRAVAKSTTNIRGLDSPGRRPTIGRLNTARCRQFHSHQTHISCIDRRRGAADRSARRDAGGRCRDRIRLPEAPRRDGALRRKADEM